MANPFPFTAGQILTAAQMNGIGEYEAYTPTFTNLTLGNGTVDFKFAQVSKLIHVMGSITFGSTTSITGLPRLTLPVARSGGGTFPILGDVLYSDTGSLSYPGIAIQITSNNTATLYVPNVASTYPTPTGLSSTIPFTWANTDEIMLNLIYQAA